MSDLKKYLDARFRNLDNKLSNLVKEEVIKAEIESRTGEFAMRVTKKMNGMSAEKRAEWIDEMFDDNARLRPTVGQVTRTKIESPTIKQYFSEYFSVSNIEDLSVLNACHDVVKLSDDMYANYATVQFRTDKDKWDPYYKLFSNMTTVTAEMSFIWKKDCRSGVWRILLLHSSPIFVDVPDILQKQGDVFKCFPLNNLLNN